MYFILYLLIESRVKHYHIMLYYSYTHVAKKLQMLNVYLYFFQQTFVVHFFFAHWNLAKSHYFQPDNMIKM